MKTEGSGASSGGSVSNKSRKHEVGPTGNFVNSFKEPTASELGEVILGGKFPYKPLQKIKLIAGSHLRKGMDDRNITMREVSTILNNKNEGYRSRGKTILVSRNSSNNKFNYVVINKQNELISVLLGVNLPKYINKSHRLW